MIRLLKGQAIVTGPFWLVNLLRFHPGGAEQYQRYATAIEPAMRAVGARPIFASYTCRTVVNGGGALMPVDGVFIGEYPCPSSLIQMNQSSAYQAAHHFRAAALLDTAMYVIPPRWIGETGGAVSRAPNPAIRASLISKTQQQLEAINGNPADFMEFLADDRFDSADAPVWMLNFLKFEADGSSLYDEYGIRAQVATCNCKPVLPMAMANPCRSWACFLACPFVGTHFWHEEIGAGKWWWPGVDRA